MGFGEHESKKSFVFQSFLTVIAKCVLQSITLVIDKLILTQNNVCVQSSPLYKDASQMGLGVYPTPV